ncbi:thioesterase family protein [Brackiella oedipodis]|uniref:thioesterase family protein n=1 Tax=Brackiella oedipodis TaxID=124225 RepID=UPI0004919212|nr:thioesterase family protein [Brackiella oedipodis]
MTDAYYELKDRQTLSNGAVVATYQPTLHAQGAWQETEQHMAPATGIICHELDIFQPQDHLRIGRVSLDIWGMIYLDEFTVTTQIERPGRTIQLLKSELKAKNRTCIVAYTWRMVTTDSSSVMGLEDQPIPSPEAFPTWTGMRTWQGGYIRSVTAKKSPESRNGAGIVWLSNSLDMVKGEPTSDFCRLMGMVDTSNGIVTREPLGEFKWMFPNVDLQIHLFRAPQGHWLGLETTQQFGPDGIGLTSSVLHDTHGPFGRSEQILTVRPIPEGFKQIKHD